MIALIIVSILGVLALLTMSAGRPAHWQRNPIAAGRSAQPRTILITGATGFIGRHLCRRLVESGDQLLVLTRSHAHARDLYGPHARIYTALDQVPHTSRIDAIVNLAGAPIFANRWTARRRQELIDSRLNVTGALVDLIARLENKPRVLISASAVGYYGVRGDEELAEVDRGQTIFQSQLCQLWELAAQRAGDYGVRVCRLRLGLVLGRGGGALSRLMLSARLRLCVILGTGRQWMSWIHITDVTQLICACIEREELRGPINATAPVPVRQKEFAETLAQCFGRVLPVRVPEQMLRWGLAEMSQLLLEGQRVLPVKAHCAGLDFEFSNLTAALHDLVARASPAEPAEILYDSLCPVCDVEMNAYCRAAQRVGFRWRFADVAARMELMTRYRLDLATARKRVYMLNDAGEMLSGIDALASIWMALPRWRVVARIVRLPLIRPLAAGFYDRVLAPLIWRWNARRRRSLQGEPASW